MILYRMTIVRLRDKLQMELDHLRNERRESMHVLGQKDTYEHVIGELNKILDRTDEVPT